MLFATGSRVKFKHTGFIGIVIERINDDMVSVRLDDGDEIPAFVEDLERVDEQKSGKHIKAKVVPGKMPKAPSKPDLPEVEIQYSILRSLGLQLAFEPQYLTDGSTRDYQIYLINDTGYPILFRFELLLNQRSTLQVEDKIEGVAYRELGILNYDHLNESPLIRVECWQVTTVGTGNRQEKQIRIKPQQFFKRQRTAPLLNRLVQHYILFDQFDEPTSSEEDLRTYTRLNARPAARRRQGNSDGIIERASFNPEIDLHIEQLTNNAGSMSKADMLRLQLQHFDRFLNQAIQVGVPRIYVIHGLGKGRLRNEIATRLMKHPAVRTFKNEFHPNYGYGATEIFLD